MPSVRNSQALSEYRNDVGPRLKKIRLGAGLSLHGLAAKLQLAGWDCAHNTIATYEARRRSLTDIEIKAILSACGKNWRDL